MQASAHNYNKKLETINTQKPVEEIIQNIKDLFYSTRKTLYDIY